MSAAIWYWVTPLGNSAILLPVAGLVAAFLWLRPQTRRLGFLWCATLAAECLFVAGTKLVYMAWGWRLPGVNFIGLSGDTAMAFVFWPAAAAMVVPRSAAGWRLLAVCVAAVPGLLVAKSRVFFHAHSVAEVVGGGLFGATIVGVFLARSWREPPAVSARVAWVPVVVLVAALLATAAQPRPIDYTRLFSNTAKLLTGHQRIYKRCDLGPWAALEIQPNACVPHGPESMSG